MLPSFRLVLYWALRALPSSFSLCDLVPQDPQGGSLTQQRDEDEEDEDGGNSKAYEYATKNLLHHGMHDEDINLDLNK